MSEELATPLRRWLLSSRTRRQVAKALGGGDHPNDAYLRMATSICQFLWSDAINQPHTDPTWAGRSSDPTEAEAMGEQWSCAWCGASLEPLQTGWTDLEYGSGEFCPEGEAVRDWGTSPHLPVRAGRSSDPEPAPGVDGATRGKRCTATHDVAGWCSRDEGHPGAHESRHPRGRGLGAWWNERYARGATGEGATP